jgi:hypothetical protein
MVGEYLPYKDCSWYILANFTNLKEIIKHGVIFIINLSEIMDNQRAQIRVEKAPTKT